MHRRCGVRGRGATVAHWEGRHADREAGGSGGAGGASSMQAGPNCGGCWQGTRAERTVNMELSFVTLDMSKLSCWSNASAACREGSSGSMGRGGGGVQSRGAGRGHARGAHVKHVVHGRDAGRVKAQRLVERLRILPSGKREHGKRGRHAEPQGWEGVGTAAAAQAACREGASCGGSLAGGTRGKRT